MRHGCHHPPPPLDQCMRTVHILILCPSQGLHTTRILAGGIGSMSYFPVVVLVDSTQSRMWARVAWSIQESMGSSFSDTFSNTFQNSLSGQIPPYFVFLFGCSPQLQHDLKIMRVIGPVNTTLQQETLASHIHTIKHQ